MTVHTKLSLVMTGKVVELLQGDWKAWTNGMAEPWLWPFSLNWKTFPPLPSLPDASESQSVAAIYISSLKT